MKKVDATLLYGIDEHNKYIVVEFFAVDKSGVIHTMIDNTKSINLTYKYSTMKDMIVSMKNCLKCNGFYVQSFMKNSVSECCGIVCLKMYGTDFLITFILYRLKTK